MKRQLLILFALSAVFVCIPLQSADAVHGFGHGRGHGVRGHGHGHGRGHGFGIGGAYDGGWDLAELYRELLNNVPYYALHPPVYYSYPVPRTYGYSPFAYPPHVMTPEICGEIEPLDIVNPYVPSTHQKPAEEDNNTADARSAPEPLVIINPFVTSNGSVARN